MLIISCANYMIQGVVVMCVWYTAILVTPQSCMMK